MDIEGFLADARDKLIKHPTLVALFPLFGEISAAFRRLITHITREYYSANSFICSAMSPSQGGIMTSLSAFKSSLNVDRVARLLNVAKTVLSSRCLVISHLTQCRNQVLYPG